jgi:hypothetical protein
MKSKSRSRKGRTQAALPQAKTRNWFERIPLVWRVIIFLIGVPSLYVGIVSILPRISVTPSEELNKYDPFSAPFIISNDGYIAIHSVNMPCTIDHLLLSSQTSMTNATASDDVFDDTLEPDGRSTHFCHMQITDAKTKEVIITLTVSFRPDFYPWTTIRKFHFRGL